jgi:hypothetical protein
LKDLRKLATQAGEADPAPDRQVGRPEESPAPSRIWTWSLRIFGLILLLILLVRLNLSQVGQILWNVQVVYVVIAILLLFPHLMIKALRWRNILSGFGIQMSWQAASIATFASLFIGFLTPGRLGEFVKVLYVERHAAIHPATAFSSVLADRFFDLLLLVLVGIAALLGISAQPSKPAMLLLGMAGLFAGVALFLNESGFRLLTQGGSKLGRLGKRLFRRQGWLAHLHRSLRMISARTLLNAVVLTIFAYGLFFAQTWLLAQAVHIRLGYWPIAFGTALASLAALLPISISGLGTREATLVAFLGGYGLQPELALSFSFLVFLTFNGAGGGLGALAWFFRPVGRKSTYEAEIEA